MSEAIIEDSVRIEEFEFGAGRDYVRSADKKGDYWSRLFRDAGEFPVPNCMVMLAAAGIGWKLFERCLIRSQMAFAGCVAAGVRQWRPLRPSA
jgi:hypothetical protein